MSLEDMRLNCDVKAILTQHWIDQKELRVSVHGGSVRLRGELRRLPSSEDAGAAISVLMEIVAKIRRLRGVQKVYFLDVVLRELDDKVTSRTLEEDSPKRPEVDLGKMSRYHRDGLRREAPRLDA